MNVISPFRAIRPKTSCSSILESAYIQADSVIFDHINSSQYIRKSVNNRLLVVDPHPYYYVFQISFNNKILTGIIAHSSLSNYNSGRILQHEKTLSSKIISLKKCFQDVKLQLSPVMLLHKRSPTITAILHECTQNMFDIILNTSDQNYSIKIWVISEKEKIDIITDTYNKLTTLYIADGHHRSKCLASMSENKIIEDNIMVALVDEDNIETTPIIKELYYPESISSEFLANIFSRYFNIKYLNTKEEYHSKRQITLLIDNNYYLMSLINTVADLPSSEFYFEINILLEKLFNKIRNYGITMKNRPIISSLSLLYQSKYKHKRPAIIIPPIPVNIFFEIVEQNKLLPAQSTCFLPKFPNGLILNQLVDVTI